MEPLRGNQEAVLLKIEHPHPSFALLQRAQETGELQTTNVIDLAQGGKGFVFYCPIGQGDAIDGFIVGVFRLQRFFNKSPRRSLKISSYPLKVKHYRGGNPDRYRYQLSFQALRDMGSATIGHSISQLESYVEWDRSVIPALVFLGGLVLSVLMPMCVYLFYGALHQVDEMDSAYAELETSEARFRTLAENSNDVVRIMDTNLNYTYVSPAVETFRGVTPEYAMTQEIEEYMTPEACYKARIEFADAIRQFLEDPGKGPRQVTIELEMFHADGHGSTASAAQSLRGLTANVGTRKHT